MRKDTLTGVELFNLLMSLPPEEQLAFAAKLHEEEPTTKLRWLAWLTEGEYVTETRDWIEDFHSLIRSWLAAGERYREAVAQSDAITEKLIEVRAREVANLYGRVEKYMCEAEALRPSHLELCAILKERHKPKRGTKERMQAIHRLKVDGHSWPEIHRQIDYYEDHESMRQAYWYAKRRHRDWFSDSEKPVRQR
jgi:hypothetical protein